MRYGVRMSPETGQRQAPAAWAATDPAATAPPLEPANSSAHAKTIHAGYLITGYLIEGGVCTRPYGGKIDSANRMMRTR